MNREETFKGRIKSLFTIVRVLASLEASIVHRVGRVYFAT